jgi:hypothetical protein
MRPVQEEASSSTSENEFTDSSESESKPAPATKSKPVAKSKSKSKKSNKDGGERRKSHNLRSKKRVVPAIPPASEPVIPKKPKVVGHELPECSPFVPPPPSSQVHVTEPPGSGISALSEPHYPTGSSRIPRHNNFLEQVAEGDSFYQQAAGVDDFIDPNHLAKGGDESPHRSMNLLGQMKRRPRRNPPRMQRMAPVSI